MDFSNDLIRGSVVPIVLALLNERTMYGYEIVKVVNERTNGQFRWKEGTLYPTLHRLQGQRLIKASWQTASDTGKKRKYYAITRKGLGELTKRPSEWQQFSTAVNGLLNSPLLGV